MGGTHLSQNYLKQLPVIPRHTYTAALLDFIMPRVLELTYSAWDMQPFARDLGYDGDEERRFFTPLVWWVKLSEIADYCHLWRCRAAAG